MIDYKRLTLTISFNGHFHMRRREFVMNYRLQWHNTFWIEILLSELMLIKNESSDIDKYKAVSFE